MCSTVSGQGFPRVYRAAVSLVSSYTILRLQNEQSRDTKPTRANGPSNNLQTLRAPGVGPRVSALPFRNAKVGDQAYRDVGQSSDRN